MMIEILVVGRGWISRGECREKFRNEIYEHPVAGPNLGTAPVDDKRLSADDDVERRRLRLDISHEVGHRHGHAIASGGNPVGLDDELLV